MLKFRLVPIYEKVEKHCVNVRPFTLIEYKFSNDNTRELARRLSAVDRELYPFSMKGFDWEGYIRMATPTHRLYVFNEDPKTIPRAKRKMKMLYALHYTLLAILALVFIYLCHLVLGIFS